MRRFPVRLLPVVSLFLVAACEQVERGQGEIHLPEGDADKGQALFVDLGCVSCHKVTGADLPQPEDAKEDQVVLGSTTGRALTYNQLVTSVVNPSHRLTPRYRKELVSDNGESRMRTYNDVMTVSQLSDLVAFLQAHYTKAERPGYKYPVYDYEAAEEEGSE